MSDRRYPSSSTREGAKVVRTFRIDATVDRRLKEISERENTSTNIVASNALRHFVDFRDTADQYGYQSYPRSVMMKILEKVPDDEVAELGRWDAKNAVNEFIRVMFRRDGFDSVLQTLQFLDTYGHRFTFEFARPSNASGKAQIVLTHNMGPKWSLYYKELLQALFGELDGVEEVSVRSTVNQVLVEISMSNVALTERELVRSATASD